MGVYDYNEDQFFADMEESLLDNDSPLWATEEDEPVPQEPQVLEEGESTVYRSIQRALHEAVVTADQFTPSYSAEMEEDLKSPPIIMHSLRSYITGMYPQFTTWDWCARCTLEGPYRGNRVYPSIVRMETTPFTGEPVNILVIGEA